MDNKDAKRINMPLALKESIPVVLMESVNVPASGRPQTNFLIKDIISSSPPSGYWQSHLIRSDDERYLIEVEIEGELGISAKRYLAVKAADDYPIYEVRIGISTLSHAYGSIPVAGSVSGEVPYPKYLILNYHPKPSATDPSTTTGLLYGMKFCFAKVAHHGTLLIDSKGVQYSIYPNLPFESDEGDQHNSAYAGDGLTIAPALPDMTPELVWEYHWGDDKAAACPLVKALEGVTLVVEIS